MTSRRRLLTNEQDAWLREHAPGTYIKDLTEMMNVEFATSFNAEQVRAYMSRNHIRNGMQTKGDHRKHRLFTDDEERYLLIINHMRSAKEVASMFNEKYPGKNITSEQIRSWRKNHHVRSGIDSTFKKGQIPFNEGMKWDDFMSEKGKEGSRKTQFSNGHMPHNWQPVGTERIDSWDGYAWIKVKEPKTWKQRSHIVWEKAHGPIPEGYAILHKDLNPLNDDLDNLELVSRNELRVMNQKYKLTSDPDLNETIHNVAKLDIKIRELERKGKETDGS